MSTTKGATKNATNSAASGSYQYLDSAACTSLRLDLAIEPIDQRAALPD